MAVDQQRLGQAIYDLIFDSLTMAPAGGQPATSAATTMLSLSLPGLPLDPAELEDPWSPMNPDGDPVTAENFAWLVDAIPEVSSVYTPSGRSIEALYGEIVQANTAATPPTRPAPRPAPRPPLAPDAASPPPSPEPPAVAAARLAAAPVRRDVIAARRHALQLLPARVRSAFERLYTEGTLPTPRGGTLKTFVETPAFRAYLDRRAARDEAVTRYMTRYLQTDAGDPADRARWAAAAAGLEAQIASAAQAVEAADAAQVEADMAAVAAVAAGDGGVQNNSVAAIFEAARLNFEISKLGSMWGPGHTWHMTLAHPQRWYADDAPLFEVDLRSNRALWLNSKSRFRLRGAQALGEGLWGYRAPGAISRRPIAQDTADLRVRFRFARVNIRRPWLDTSLFSLGGWSLAGRRRHALSTGTLHGNTGLFPLLPTSIIVARDLQISATWSSADVAFIRERLEAQDLTFGPFALAGEHRRPRAPAATVTRATFDGVNIDAPGLQVIGWLSKLVPACPPLNG